MPRQYTVVNTFTRMPSPAQICSYIVIALQSILFYVMIRPKMLSQQASLIFTIIFTVSLAVLLINTVICSVIDPSDPVMVREKTGRKGEISVPAQELLYCEYCQASVTMNAKHCRQCDRCVQNFDHHCMWINNCVGSRNYKPFIIMITSTCLNLGIYLSSVVYLSIEKQWTTFLGFIITCWVVMAIVFVLWFLLFNLNLLHFYLMCKGYTTYQFIVARKEEERVREYQEMQRQKREREEKLREKIQKSKKRVFEANDSQELKKTPTKSRNKLKTEQSQKISDGQVNTNTIINLQHQQHQQKHQQKSPQPQPQPPKILQTTDAKLKPSTHTQQNIENVFGEENRASSENSDVQSIKLDGNSIKGEILFKEEDLRPVNDRIQTESESESIRISQFFIRNKSFNYILSNAEATAPHKKLNNLSLEVDAKAKDKEQKDRVKSKSSSQEKLGKIAAAATKKTGKTKFLKNPKP